MVLGYSLISKQSINDVEFLLSFVDNDDNDLCPQEVIYSEI